MYISLISKFLQKLFIRSTSGQTHFVWKFREKNEKYVALYLDKRLNLRVAVVKKVHGPLNSRSLKYKGESSK